MNGRDFNINTFTPQISLQPYQKNWRLETIKNSTNEKICIYYRSINNPTWKLYADNDFPGTKQFPRPSGSAFDIIEFHFLDQVLLSQKLKNEVKEERIFVLKETTTFKLYNRKYNRVDYSDHLPIVYEFKN